MRKTGKAALLAWCKKNTEGYKDVNVTNFTTSWRDGLAFCALIHNFAPGAIDFNSVPRGNPEVALEMAFTTAEKLGVPALLDVEDMLIASTPEPLSVMTYLSQFYQHFVNKKGGSVRATGGIASIKEDSDGTTGEVSGSKRPKTESSDGVPEGKTCAKCSKALGGQVIGFENGANPLFYHKDCFSCAKCKRKLEGGQCINVQGQPYCDRCGKKEWKKSVRSGRSGVSKKPAKGQTEAEMLAASRKKMEDALKRKREASSTAPTLSPQSSSVSSSKSSRSRSPFNKSSADDDKKKNSAASFLSKTIGFKQKQDLKKLEEEAELKKKEEEAEKLRRQKEEEEKAKKRKEEEERARLQKKQRDEEEAEKRKKLAEEKRQAELAEKEKRLKELEKLKREKEEMERKRKEKEEEERKRKVAALEALRLKQKQEEEELKKKQEALEARRKQEEEDREKQEKLEQLKKLKALKLKKLEEEKERRAEAEREEAERRKIAQREEEERQQIEKEKLDAAEKQKKLKQLRKLQKLKRLQEEKQRAEEQKKRKQAEEAEEQARLQREKAEVAARRLQLEKQREAQRLEEEKLAQERKKLEQVRREQERQAALLEQEEKKKQEERARQDRQSKLFQQQNSDALLTREQKLAASKLHSLLDSKMTSSSSSSSLPSGAEAGKNEKKGSSLSSSSSSSSRGRMTNRMSKKLALFEGGAVSGVLSSSSSSSSGKSSSPARRGTRSKSPSSKGEAELSDEEEEEDDDIPPPPMANLVEFKWDELEGFLEKEDPKGFLSIKAWRRRWFSLQGTRLMYFKEQQEKGSHLGRRAKTHAVLLPQGYISLPFAQSIDIVQDKPNTFSITTRDRTYFLHAATKDEMHLWVGTLNRTLVKVRKLFPTQEDKDFMYKQGPLDRLVFWNIWSTNHFVLKDGILFRYSSKGAAQSQKLALYAAKLEEYGASEDKHIVGRCFQITTDIDKIVLRAKDEIEMQQWLNAMLRQKILIEETIDSISF